MQFLQCSIPEMILENIVKLLQPFCQETITTDDVKEALLQYKRPMLTVAEFAVRTKYSKKTVYRFIDKGRIVAYKSGNAYRIPESEISRICVKLEGTNEDNNSGQ